MWIVVWKMISLILMALSGACKSISDTCLFHYDTSIFKGKLFFNSNESWKMKYKNGDKAQGDRFFLSSTVLVGFTDSFHLFGMINSFLICAAIVLYIPITGIKIKVLSVLVDFVIIKIAHQSVFHAFYTWIFVRKK